ncbi:MAG TPA: bifunctional DNA-binding transcriptional regulator/O6-methylguanine-DNA methyltransferase Ada [Candidatus Acidoferrales bacterium]|nr:bifunctional DNA-binding transcriptional regulator/O6-methylguanine-DNA methyltransferase Ada [Candidatus Acidoferrales bacterium]
MEALPISTTENPPARLKPAEDLKLLTETEKRNAIRKRDRLYDGRFIFAVRSTGIYCNPSCPAKRASSSQVLFFPSSAEAERSGFRPCQRCKPNENSKPPQTFIVERLCDYIQKNLDKKLNLLTLSAEVGLSQYYLQRIFKRIVGVTPRQYIETLRLVRMKRSLMKGETVTKAIYSAGFSSKSRFYEKGSYRFGMSPGVLRRGGAGMRIRYTIASCPLGRLLVAGTEFGICAVCMADSEGTVERALSEQYPSAILQRNDESMREWVAEIQDYLSGDNVGLNLPIDTPTATAFQAKVWNQIGAIPYGRTASYTNIAVALGKPKAARAVARACATNPVALLIPCHRVIGEDGELHGYRWGNERKQRLLRLEQTTNT